MTRSMYDSSHVYDMCELFNQFTTEHIDIWEKAVLENPKATWSDHCIADLLPFVKRVLPRVSVRSQSLFGFSLISLVCSKPENEKEIIQYGLEPLIAANILTQQEADQIINWYIKTDPTWDSMVIEQFKKEFEIEGHRYLLLTDSYRDFRDLNLMIL